MAVGDWVTLVVGALGLVGLLSSSLAVLRSKGITTSLELLRGTVTDLSTDNQNLRIKVVELTSENTKLYDEVRILRDLVTSRATVERLVTELTTLTAEVRGNHQTILARLVHVIPTPTARENA